MASSPVEGLPEVEESMSERAIVDIRVDTGEGGTLVAVIVSLAEISTFVEVQVTAPRVGRCASRVDQVAWAERVVIASSRAPVAGVDTLG